MSDQTKIRDLWKRKDDYISSRLDWLKKKVDRSQSLLLEELVRSFVGDFSIDDQGNLKANVRNMRMAIKLDQFFDTLDDEYLRAVNTRYGEDMLKLTDLSGRYYSAMGTPKEVVQSIAEKVGFIEQGIGIRDGQIVKGGYLDTITKMPEVRQDLKDYVTQSVGTKKGYSEYLKGMQEIVQGTKTRDGMIERYYKQFAYDTFNQTDAAINQHYADSLNLVWFVYEGSLIDTSRPFCRKRAGKVYSTEETERWKCDPELIGKPSGKKCDDKYNPLIERGRWNCRHTIRYITEDLACDMGRIEACSEDQQVGTPVQAAEEKPQSIQLNKDAINELDRVEQSGGAEDVFMTKMNQIKGNDSLPRKVSKGDMDGLISKGHTDMYRGVADKKFVDEFAEGKFFSGKGVYGNGTYAAVGSNAKQAASHFTGATKQGGVMRMTVQKGAKQIEFDDLIKDFGNNKYIKMANDMEAYSNDLLLQQYAPAQAKGLASPIRGITTAEDAQKATRVLREIGKDPGRVALADGYDVIRTSGKIKYGDVESAELVILNRSKTILQWP